MQSRSIRFSKESIRAPRKGRPPYLFGRGGRDRALRALAANGPLTVRELARLTKTDSHKTFTMVERLCESGLVVKRNRPGGRKYVAINKRLDIYPELMALLLALNAKFPPPLADVPPTRWGMWDDAPADTTFELVDHMFQSPVRSRVLLFIAAAGSTDYSSVVEMLEMNGVSASYVINAWEREGVLETRAVRNRRIIRLNPRFEAAAELAMLLNAIVMLVPHYQRLGKGARERMADIARKAKKPRPKPKR